MTRGIDALLSPRSVAVIGASPREDSLGFRVIRNLRSLGFPGRIAPVNPRYAEVADLPCFASIEAVEGPVDAAVLAVPADVAVKLVPAMGQAGIRALLIPAGGYDDTGTPEGAALQADLKAEAARHGVAICGPNNMGLINVHGKIGLWTAARMPGIKPGRLAVLSQSGSVAIALSQDERGLGLSHVISSGNEADLTAADYLAALCRDENVDVVALFLETIRNPERFAEAAAAMQAAGKRVVALKVGRTEVSRAAVAAHTGALAGEPEVYDAFFRKCGVVCVRDFEELTAAAALCLAYPRSPSVPGAVVLTLSGGEAALASDLAADAGLPLPAFGASTLGRLAPALPPLAKPHNPLDVWGSGWDADRFSSILATCAAGDDAGTVAISVDAPSSGGGDTAIALQMAEIAGTVSGPAKLVFINNVGGANGPLNDALAEAGVPCLSAMRAGLAAIAKWAAPVRPLSRGAVPAGTAAADEVTLLTRAPEPDRYAALRSAGIPMIACRAIGSADEAVAAAEALGCPVVLKASAPTILHRSEADLVRLRLSGADAVAAAYRHLTTALDRHAGTDPHRTIVLQPMASAGVELIVGFRNEPHFGTLALIGLGGIFVEILRDTAIEFAPLDIAAAEDMIRSTRAGVILAGARGHVPYDIAAAAAALVAVSELGLRTQGRLRSLEINPLIVFESGGGAAGVDVAVEVHDRGSED